MSLHSMDEMCVAGCATRRAIRLWEDEGLLGEVYRSEGGTRKFTDKQIKLAKIIAAAQFGSFELSQISLMLKEYDTDVQVHDALVTRLADQVRMAARLAEGLPKPAVQTTEKLEYDL